MIQVKNFKAVCERPFPQTDQSSSQTCDCTAQQWLLQVGSDCYGLGSTLDLQ